MNMSYPESSFVLFSEHDQLPDYGNERVFQRNQLPARAYYLPETSLLLSGTWDFNYASTPLEAPEPFHSNIRMASDTESTFMSGASSNTPLSSLNIEAVSTETQTNWSKINVPGHWQLQGHGRPQYTNVIFPFPVCPPHVPTENPTGTYRRKFSVPSAWEESSQLRLRFDGVDSSFHVWINGCPVGYHQGSRNASEFDITTFVKRHVINEVFVRVYQWCDGSYIEDQDQWWLSGIFRDVYLLAFPGEARIEDFFVETILDKQYKDATLNVSLDLFLTMDVDVSLVLKDPAKNYRVVKSETLSTGAGTSGIKLQLQIPQPRKWTAETPYLYNLTIGLLSRDGEKSMQTISHQVGFRSVELKNGLITVNGSPIFLRGVNRHDHHPFHGRAVPLEFIRKDLLLMKQHNINALRCSHYPSHPRLYELCDEFGFWVVNEADLENHGFYDAVARPLDIPEAMDYEQRKTLAFPQAARFTSDNDDWRGQYLDRMTQLIQRDKNHPSIIIWSLGNEAFYGRNHRAMFEYAKLTDPGRLVHYEGDANAETADMFSYMYPSVERLIELSKTAGIKDGKFEKPIILCEYAHAMGNGPGGLKEYQAAFRDNKRLQGGFIWEWANHGLWKESDSEGSGFYAYGGDFGDIPNDDTFVMDGLCFSNHTPTPGLTEFKKVTEPIRAWITGEELFVENGYDYIDLSDIVIVYKVELFEVSTKIAASGEFIIPETRAGECGMSQLPQVILNFRRTNGAWLTVSFRLKSSTSWADAGHEISWLQHQLSSPGPVIAPRNPVSQAKEVQIRTSKLEWVIGNIDFEMIFDRARGCLKSWVVNGSQLLETDPKTGAALCPSFWRCPTDNDRPSDEISWRRYGLDSMTSQLRSTSIDCIGPGEIELQSTTYISPPILAWGFDATTTYRITSAGCLTVKIHLVPRGAAPEFLPRIGLNIRLNKNLAIANWLGLGPGESYSDKHSAQKVGIYTASVSDLATPYEVPQENGNRMDARWVRMLPSSHSGLGIQASRVDGDGMLQWAAGRYSPETLERARHPRDLLGKEESGVLWRVDACGAGVGTAACGPGVGERYRVKCEDFEFEIRLEGVLL